MSYAQHPREFEALSELQLNATFFVSFYLSFSLCFRFPQFNIDVHFSKPHKPLSLSLSIFLLRVSKHQLAQINVIRIIFKLNINTNCPISHSHMMLMAAVKGFIFLNSSITFRSCAFISWFSHIHLPPTHLHTHTHILVRFIRSNVRLFVDSIVPTPKIHWQNLMRVTSF